MSESRLEEVIARYLQDLDAGRNPSREQYLAQHADLALELRGFFAGLDRMGGMASDQTARLPTAESALEPNTMLGPYRIESLLGRGGMGTVYRATHVHLNRVVAVKILPARLSGNPQFIDRFKREARALAQLQHPAIVAVHDMGVQGDCHYIVMELVDGVTLRDLIAQHALTAEQALSLVPRICEALEYAHRHGIVHRDIKPENILIDRLGQPKILDFGLARIVHGAPEEQNLTRSSQVMGTLNYMAPEQRLSANVDHRADIYALGVVLYEMLTGQVPGEPFTPPSSRLAVDRRVDQVVERALEKDPEQRYQRANHMGQDVTKVITPGDAADLRATDLRSNAGYAIFNGDTGDRLADGRGPLRVIAHGADSIEVMASPRPEISLKGVAKPPLIEVSAAGTVLHLPKTDAVLVVPETLALSLESSEADLVVAGMRAALDVTPGSGAVTVKNHRGSLRVARTEDGSIEVHGLDSRDFALTTSSGRLGVVGLRFRAGEGVLRSQEGEITVGVIEPESDLAYEVHSATGQVAVSVGTPLTTNPQSARGELGRGTGHLRVETTSGDVSLDTNQATVALFGYQAKLDHLDWIVFLLMGGLWMFVHVPWYLALVAWLSYHALRRTLWTVLKRWVRPRTSA